MSDRPVREYIRRVGRLWGNHIAGPIAAGFAIILPVVGLLFHSSTMAAIWLGLAPLVVAIVLIWPAQYGIWKQEREARVTELANERDKREKEVAQERQKREAEEAKNQTPELTGEVLNFRAQGNFGQGDVPEIISHFEFVCEMYVCNRRQTPTTIRSVDIDTSAIKPKAEFKFLEFISEPRFMHPLLRVSPPVLEHGVGQRIYMHLDAIFEGLLLSQIGNVDLTGLKVRLTDSFGSEHLLSVKPGEFLQKR